MQSDRRPSPGAGICPNASLEPSTAAGGASSCGLISPHHPRVMQPSTPCRPALHAHGHAFIQGWPLAFLPVDAWWQAMPLRGVARRLSWPPCFTEVPRPASAHLSTCTEQFASGAGLPSTPFFSDRLCPLDGGCFTLLPRHAHALCFRAVAPVCCAGTPPCILRRKLLPPPVRTGMHAQACVASTRRRGLAKCSSTGPALCVADSCDCASCAARH